MATQPKQPFWTKIVFPIATKLGIVVYYANDRSDAKFVLTFMKPRDKK